MRAPLGIRCAGRKTSPSAPAPPSFTSRMHGSHSFLFRAAKESAAVGARAGLMQVCVRLLYVRKEVCNCWRSKLPPAGPRANASQKRAVYTSKVMSFLMRLCRISITCFRCLRSATAPCAAHAKLACPCCVKAATRKR